MTSFAAFQLVVVIGIENVLFKLLDFLTSGGNWFNDLAVGILLLPTLLTPPASSLLKDLKAFPPVMIFLVLFNEPS